MLMSNLPQAFVDKYQDHRLNNEFLDIAEKELGPFLGRQFRKEVVADTVNGPLHSGEMIYGFYEIVYRNKPETDLGGPKFKFMREFISKGYRSDDVWFRQLGTAFDDDPMTFADYLDFKENGI